MSSLWWPEARSFSPQIFQELLIALFDEDLECLKYLSFAQINDNELRPEQGEQTRGQSFGKWVRWVEYDL